MPLPPPSEDQIEQARQRADQDPEEIQHRVRHAELLRRAGRIDEAAEVYRAAARAYATANDWLKAFAIARSLPHLDPGDTETQRYVTSMYRRQRGVGRRSASADGTDQASLSTVLDSPLRPALARKPRYPVEASRLPELLALEVLSDLSLPDLDAVTHHLRTLVVQRGEPIFREGEQSSGMFLILRGEVRVAVVDDAGWLTTLATLGQGQFFGEFRMLGSPARQALVEAITRVELLDVDEELYELLTERSPAFRAAVGAVSERRQVENVLARASLFSRLSPNDRIKLAASFQRQSVRPHELVVARGDPAGRICLLGHGKLELYQRDDDKKVVLAELVPGQFLRDPGVVTGGEYGLYARAVVVSQVFWVDRTVLLEILGRTPDGRESFEQAFAEPEFELSADDIETPDPEDSFAPLT